MHYTEEYNLNGNVYLAGPIRGLTYGECTDWREYATMRLNDIGLVGVSPMRGKDYLKDKGPLLGDRGSGAFEEFPMSSEQGIFGRDLFDTGIGCDIILANFEGATSLSIGTAMEIQHGYDNKKYVLTVLESGALHDHPFIRRASSLVVPTLEYALEVLYVLTAPYVRGVQPPSAEITPFVPTLPSWYGGTAASPPSRNNILTFNRPNGGGI